MSKCFINVNRIKKFLSLNFCFSSSSGGFQSQCQCKAGMTWNGYTVSIY